MLRRFSISSHIKSLIVSIISITDRTIKKNALLFWVIFFFIFSSTVWSIWDKNLHVILCDVGQGDAILLRWRQTELLIDAGQTEKVLECLSREMPIWDRTLEVVFATHLDSDHVGGLKFITKRYKIGLLITNHDVWGKLGLPRDTSPVQPMVSGEKFRVGPMAFFILWPPEETIKKSDPKAQTSQGKSSAKASTNAESLAIRLEFGGFSGLFLGDLGIPEEKAMISSGALEAVTLLKVGHHGSNGSTSDELIATTRPIYAFIGVGKNNRYSHPTVRVIQLLERSGITIFRTDNDGAVELQTDGRSVWRPRRWF